MRFYRSCDRGSEGALKNATSEAVERGIFGALTFFVGEEMFWGNDRFCFVEQALVKNGRC